MDNSPAARQPRFFYGWVIVGVMTVIGGLTMAMAGFNFGLFIRPMGQDLGISRQTFGWALSARQLAGAFTGPQVGRVLDRRGARLLLIAATTITCAGMVGLAYVETGWQLIAVFVVMGAAGMTGPGAMLISVPVAKWFVQRRGLAMGIMSVGTPLGAVIMVPLTQILIGRFGWQDSWLILAVLCFAIVVPLALFVRRQPEDMGLRPDGAPATGEAGRAASRANAVLELASFTVREATHTVTFWRLVVVFSLVMLAMGSVGLHRIPHFTDEGISAGWVSAAISADAASACVSTFLMGWLIQRWPARYVGAVGFALLAVGVGVTIFAHTIPLMFLSMVIFGLGAGGMILLQGFLWADYFGRAQVGAIRGASMPITLVFSAAGPPIAGLVYDQTGSYNPVWWVGIGLMVTGAIVLALTPPPKKGVHHPASSPSDERERARGGLPAAETAGGS
ncbi:MAG: MFS transporter [Dehalococcoidia bacterium]